MRARKLVHTLNCDHNSELLVNFTQETIDKLSWLEELNLVNFDHLYITNGPLGPYISDDKIFRLISTGAYDNMTGRIMIKICEIGIIAHEIGHFIESQIRISLGYSKSCYDGLTVFPHNPFVGIGQLYNFVHNLGEHCRWVMSNRFFVDNNISEKQSQKYYLCSLTEIFARFIAFLVCNSQIAYSIDDKFRIYPKTNPNDKWLDNFCENDIQTFKNIAKSLTARPISYFPHCGQIWKSVHQIDPSTKQITKVLFPK